MEFQDIRYDVRDGIARLTLNKPEKLNALSWGSWAELETAVRAADSDDAARVIVITGEGRGFSAGTDLTVQTSESEWPARPYTGRAAQERTRYLGTADVFRCRKPTIAAVNGVAVGAGFSLALACDMRIAAESARFGAVFVKRGIVADTGCTWFLPRLVGMEQALRLMFTGRIIGAREALDLGIVGEVVPDSEFQQRVSAFATEIANGPTLAIELMKRLAYEGQTRGLDEQIEMEQFLQQITHGTEDAAEGRRSFLEKREPVFKGR